MDFLDPKKKRAHKIRLYIGYALMAIALSMVTAILLFEALGFDLNRKTGEIIQNGLVFVNAHPEQADVYMNGEMKGKTDMRLTIPAGDYTFEFKRNGYRDWKRHFTLIGSEIERLNYVFMFPVQLNTSDIRTYDAPASFATQSPDRKWLIVQRPGQIANFDIVNLGESNNPVTSLALPSGLLTAGTGHSFETTEWSNDNRHFILKHTYKGGSEFIIVDREQPQQSLNLNKHLDTTIYSVAMRDKKHDKLHVLNKNGGTLVFADTKSKQTTPIANKAHSFKSYGDDVILYTTSEGAKKSTVKVDIRKGDKTYAIRSLTEGKSYPLDITRYDDEWYLAVGSDTDKKAYIYREVFKDLEKKPSLIPAPVAVFRFSQLDMISVSANSRFLAAQGGSKFGVYDAEHNRQYEYDTGLKLAAGQKASWMDGHRLVAGVDNKLTVWDYDGINTQTLVAMSPGFKPYFDRDYDFLYSINNSSGKGVVTKTPMRTQEDL